MRFRPLLMLSAVYAILLASACSSDELRLPTSAAGSRTLQGQVVPGDGITAAGGVTVSVLGTGLAVITDDRGAFVVDGLPESATTLHFTRVSDGIDATLEIGGSVSHVVVELARGSARARSRGMGRPEGVTPGPAQQAEGRVVSADGSALVVETLSGVEWTFTLTDSTVIRKGNQTFDVSVLVPGTRVHVRAALDEARTALEVKLRGEGEGEEGEDEGTPARTANGIVSEVGESHLMVLTADARTIRVLVDENTRIKRRGREITLAQIAAGDRAEAVGVSVDEATILAKKIETQAR